MIKSRLPLLILILGLLLGGMLYFLPPGDWPRKFLAGLAYLETITPDYLKSRHAAERLKVLIVPGHDNEYSGASFGRVREADLNLELAAELLKIFNRDPHFIALSARDLTTGDYLPELADYFVNQRAEIERFRLEHEADFQARVARGEVALQTGIHHGYAKTEVAARLYGINKWANEKDVDVVIHIHFNDYAGRRKTEIGSYTGFAVYVPERQYPNSRASVELGEAISRQLQNFLPLSDLPQEAQSVVEDQDLIAIGTRGTRLGAAVLVEYGYIYEAQFRELAVRRLILPELAWQTYQGLRHYFDPLAPVDETLLLPAAIEEDLRFGERGNAAVLVLQKILQREGFYPPAGKTLRQCPLNGNFGPCVNSAVAGFQYTYSLPVTGVVGPRTRAQLNQLGV